MDNLKNNVDNLKNSMDNLEKSINEARSAGFSLVEVSINKIGEIFPDVLWDVINSCVNLGANYVNLISNDAYSSSLNYKYILKSIESNTNIKKSQVVLSAECESSIALYNTLVSIDFGIKRIRTSMLSSTHAKFDEVVKNVSAQEFMPHAFAHQISHFLLHTKYEDCIKNHNNFETLLSLLDSNQQLDLNAGYSYLLNNNAARNFLKEKCPYTSILKIQLYPRLVISAYVPNTAPLKCYLSPDMRNNNGIYDIVPQRLIRETYTPCDPVWPTRSHDTVEELISAVGALFPERFLPLSYNVKARFSFTGYTATVKSLYQIDETPSKITVEGILPGENKHIIVVGRDTCGDMLTCVLAAYMLTIEKYIFLRQKICKSN